MRKKTIKIRKRNGDRRQIQFGASETKSGCRALQSGCLEVSWKYKYRLHWKMVESVRFLVTVWKWKRLLEGLLREKRSKTRTLKMPPLRG